MLNTLRYLLIVLAFQASKPTLIDAQSRSTTFGRLTVEDANKLIVDALFQQTGRRDEPRRKSVSTADWPGAKNFVRVEQTDVPILGTPDLTATKLDVLAVAGPGEVFALVDQRNVLALMNPLGGGLDQSGLWYKVRLLEGTQGWIFAEPHGHQGPPIARAFAAQRAERAETTDNNTAPKRASPGLAESLVRPISDPKVTTAQRVGRAIGVVLGGGLAVLFVVAMFGTLLFAATGRGWRWRWWWEQARRLLDSRMLSRSARGA